MHPSAAQCCSHACLLTARDGELTPLRVSKRPRRFHSGVVKTHFLMG